MKVCIAEKPSVAREIAQVIGANSRRDGYFEGNGYQVTWTFGHFCTLWPPGDYIPLWKKWELNSLPMLPEKFETKVMDNSGVKKQFKIIKRLFKKADLVINCGDAGTEGELIQRWVINRAGYKGPVKRLWISSLTTDAIKKGFGQLRPASDFDHLYYAASSRAIGDWLLGMNATRLYTLKYGGYKQVLSVGRVQTPTLAMLVKRYHEIKNFEPQPYWELQTLYKAVTFKYTKGRFDQQEQGLERLEQIQSLDLSITNITKKDAKEYAPKLYDLTSIQVHCNNKYGFSADKTLKLVQKLYEQKVVSYPRVDTTYLPDDLYPQIPGILTGLSNYDTYTAQLLRGKIKKTKKIFDDKKVTDHHAIIPTGVEKTLYGDEQKVYDMIVRRFLAVFYPDCKTAKTTVEAQVDKLLFVAKGKEIIDPGWRILFPKKKKSTDLSGDNGGSESDGENKSEEENILPSFTKGEQGPHKPSLLQKTTKAPAYYTEGSLLRAMETAGKQVDDEELRELMKTNGIGRPSTRANIIETLFRRKYTVRKKKQIHPTDTGIQLIAIIKNQLLKSAELTGQWEKKLKEIEQAKYSATVFITEMKTLVDQLVTEVKNDTSGKRLIAPQTPYKGKSNTSKYTKSNSKSRARTKRKTPKASSSKKEMSCPLCKEGTIIKGNTRYGCSRFKEGCHFGLAFIFKGKKISDTQIKRLVNKGSTVNLKGFKVDNQKVDGIIELNTQHQMVLVTKTVQPTSKVNRVTKVMPLCPKCKRGKIMKGRTAYGCSDWKQGCDYRYSFADLITQAGKTYIKDISGTLIQV